MVLTHVSSSAAVLVCTSGSVRTFETFDGVQSSTGLEFAALKISPEKRPHPGQTLRFGSGALAPNPPVDSKRPKPKVDAFGNLQSAEKGSRAQQGNRSGQQDVFPTLGTSG
jgi:hypothetical protein